jgi:hypothetical protein
VPEAAFGAERGAAESTTSVMAQLGHQGDHEAARHRLAEIWA